MRATMRIRLETVSIGDNKVYTVLEREDEPSVFMSRKIVQSEIHDALTTGCKVTISPVKC